MTATTAPATGRRSARLGRAGVPLLLVGAILMMVVPLPAVLLDLLLAGNISLGILVILAVLALRDPLEFSGFPSLLLIATLVRLALNVSSTRLILLEGYAGKVIETFGNFVVGGSVVVGLVVFLILVVIQFAVVTNGAGRVAEVAARFALDAMPGKQMAIDADLAAGLINEVEARDRRRRIARESDFYGAMDGASKFVKGDAIAGIVIVLINLVGGLAIGVADAGLSLGEAASTYSLLTVGDGLVSQIPALLLSVSTGLLVSRVDDDDDLGPQLHRQVLGGRAATRMGAFVISGIGLIPGLPAVPFLLLGAGLFAASSRAAKDADETPEDEEPADVTVSDDDPETLIQQLRVEPLELHLAYDILDLIDKSRGGDLLDRVKALRHQIAEDLGLVMPLVRTRDDVGLPPATYRILVHGVAVAEGFAPGGQVLALPMGESLSLPGVPVQETVEPVFGLKAYWVPDDARAEAAAAGATVVDRSSAIVTHLAEVVRAQGAELLSRQQVQQLVEGLRYDEPLLAGEVGTETLPLALLHEVLRDLLRERVPIRDLARIVDAMSSAPPEGRTRDQLVSAARAALGAAIVARISPHRRLSVVTLTPAAEAAAHGALRDVGGSLHLVLDPERTASWCQQVSEAAAVAPSDQPLVLVCGQVLRRPLRRLLETAGLDVPVLAYPELPDHLDLTPIGAITDDGDTHG